MSRSRSTAAVSSDSSEAMCLVSKEMLDEYLRDDAVFRLLEAASRPEDERFASHRWLRHSLPKRFIYQRLYGDLMSPTPSRRTVLDVGGGYTALTRVLLQTTEYTLLDLLSHDDRTDLAAIESETGVPFHTAQDWYSYDGGPFDVIIANDLFPNVDQRLGMFIEQYLPRCKELRLSLTYYNTPRWYAVKRLEGDEILHVLAWDGNQLRRVLEPYASLVDTPCFDVLHENPPSLYENGRQVCLVRLRGESEGD